LRWLNVAANGGATYQRLVEAGNPRISGGGVCQESNAAVEAVIFRGKGRVTLILQNALDESRSWQVGTELKLGIPSHVERLTAPDLADSTIRIAEVESVSPATNIQFPAYSVTRVVWDKR